MVYLSEFPERMKAAHIFNLFVEHGELAKVVIPPKRNKFGKRFGFARFRGVNDCIFLVVKLDNIFNDRNKIYANVLRFERNDEVSMRGDFRTKEKSMNSGPNMDNSRKVNPSSGKIDIILFVEVVNKGRSFNGQEERTSSVFLKYHSEENALISLRKAYVGVVINPSMSYNIRMSFKIEGYFNIKVGPLGSNILEEILSW